MKTTIEGLNDRLEDVEEQHNLKDRVVETTEVEQKTEKKELKELE